MKVAVTLFLGMAGWAVAQTPSVKHFEVASVKRVVETSGEPSLEPLGGDRFTAHKMPLQVLISVAYGVDSRYVTGCPAWMDTEVYSIDAKAGGDAPVSKEDMQAMLQQLLKESFHLAVHRETRELSGYALVVAKGGAKLHAVKEAGGQFNILPDGIVAPGASMKTLASMLSGWLHQPVIDETGVTGLYDVDLKFAQRGAVEPELPSIFTAVQETMGLKLEPRKVPVEMLVVDHADKEPVEN